MKKVLKWIIGIAIAVVVIYLAIMLATAWL